MKIFKKSDNITKEDYDTLYELTGKYANLYTKMLKYKHAWEELKYNFGFETIEDEKLKKDCLGNFMYKLEEKYRIGE